MHRAARRDPPAIGHFEIVFIAGRCRKARRVGQFVARQVFDIRRDIVVDAVVLGQQLIEFCLLDGRRHREVIVAREVGGHFRLDAVGFRALGIGGDEVARRDVALGIARGDRLGNLIAGEIAVIRSKVQRHAIAEQPRFRADFVIGQRFGIGEQPAILDIARFEAGADAGIAQRRAGQIGVGADQPGQLVPRAMGVVVADPPQVAVLRGLRVQRVDHALRIARTIQVDAENAGQAGDRRFARGQLRACQSCRAAGECDIAAADIALDVAGIAQAAGQVDLVGRVPGCLAECGGGIDRAIGLDERARPVERAVAIAIALIDVEADLVGFVAVIAAQDPVNRIDAGRFQLNFIAPEIVP